MKKWGLIIASGILMVASSCSSFDLGSGNEKLGGSTDLETNKVGFKYTATLNIDGKYVSSTTKAEVISNEDDLIKVKITGPLPDELKPLLGSEQYVNPDGTVDVTLKFKNSTEGVAYVNSDGDLTILVKYDSNVGDKWSYTTIGGKKLEREVKSKSTDNDFFWSGSMIKVTRVEQNMPYPGFTKIIYSANHKFGMVNVDLYLEDGKKISLYF